MNDDNKDDNSIFKDITRGGQMLMHAFRMFGQVMWQLLTGVFIIFALCFIWRFSTKLKSSYDFWLTVDYMECRAKLSVFDNQVLHSIKDPNGALVELKAIDFVRNLQVKRRVEGVKKAFWIACWQSLGLSIGSLGLVLWYLRRRGQKAQESVDVIGQDRVESKTLIKALKREGEASNFSLAGVPLVNNTETQHILLLGTTGTGKSVCIQELMDQVRAKKQRAIVYDIDGIFIPHYYRPKQDILLNPLDIRCPAWNIWQEGEDRVDYETVAEALMPFHLSANDPFWINAAHTVFCCMARLLALQNTKDNKSLLEAIFSPNFLQELPQQLQKITSNNKPPIELMLAKNLLSESNEKTTLSIKATLSTYCKVLMYLKDEREHPLFSIHEWVKADRGDSWLFITATEQQASALKPLLSVYLDAASKATLSLKPSLERRLWFFMDELPSLHKLPSLMSALSRGRKYGASFVGGIQDIHQLYALYGHNDAESLLSLFNTRVFFRANSPKSAQWMSKALSERELLERKEGFSYGAHEMRDGVSIHQERRREAIVKEAEFLKLKNLSAFLSLPGAWPITEIKFKVKTRNKKEPAFLARQDIDMEGFKEKPKEEVLPQEPKKAKSQKKSVKKKNSKKKEKPKWEEV